MRYLGLGHTGFDRLLDRAGLGNRKHERKFSRYLAKKLLMFHYVMLEERKPYPVTKTSWFQGTKGRQKDLRRRVHPRISFQ